MGLLQYLGLLLAVLGGVVWQRVELHQLGSRLDNLGSRLDQITTRMDRMGDDRAPVLP